jgi:hypothetical protein
LIDADGYAGVYCRERIPLLIDWRIIANALAEGQNRNGMPACRKRASRLTLFVRG